MLKWRPLAFGVLRLDVDASSALNGSYGAGAIILKSDGGLVCARSWPGVKAVSVQQAELTAVLLGLHLAKFFSLQNLEVFSDAKVEIMKIRKASFSSNEDQFILDAIGRFGIDLAVVSFDFIPRSCNVTAHTIARHALSISSLIFWTESNTPLWLSHCILVDVCTTV